MMNKTEDTSELGLLIISAITQKEKRRKTTSKSVFYKPD